MEKVMSNKLKVASSLAAGKIRRMHRIFGEDGRCVIVAMDHAGFQGYGPPTADGLGTIMAGEPDAVLVNWNLARSGAEELARCGLVLRIDGGTSELGERSASDMSGLLHSAEAALSLGADAVAVMAYPGAREEHVTLRRLAELCTECDRIGLPVMAEVVPGSFAKSVDWSLENISRGVRIAVEIGADIIKTMSPPDVSDMAALVAACQVPLVALGGPKMDSEDDIVELARNVVSEGASGIAFGRNVWGSEDPKAVILRLREAVHGQA
jgi:class I fructose-bisphosphate aldolase/fructose-bisphosphate aldolase/2-amino-3,7-dideoxy-D-threo-hept-6-ulosonate synthase